MAKKKAARAQPDDAPSFEESVVELQQIVSKLEDGSLPLEGSMSQFERGISLLKNCYQILEQAEQRIEILTSIGDDGSIETERFDATATADRPGRQATERTRTDDDSDNNETSLGSRAKSIRDDALF
jgi:exodeoxyribonuclease VII small subunit